MASSQGQPTRDHEEVSLFTDFYNKLLQIRISIICSDTLVDEVEANESLVEVPYQNA